MNYIYDILINFQPVLYDFYEWNLNDNIEHIRKVPMFRVTEKELNEIRDYKIQLDRDILVKIYKKTEKFTKHDLELIPYVCIFSGEKEALAVQFDKKGIAIKKSKLLIDEENEVLDVAERVSIFPLTYKKLKKEVCVTNKTRREVATERWLRRELKKLKDRNIEKLKYLYYECFNQKEEDIKKIITNFENTLECGGNEIIERMQSFFKLTQSQK